MIEVKNITKKYGDLTVLNDFSVDFDQSGGTVLLGPLMQHLKPARPISLLGKVALGKQCS